MGERWREIWAIFKGTFADSPPEPQGRARTADAALDAAGRWMALFRGRAPWLSEGVRSMNLPAAIASETARLATVELTGHVAGGARAAYLDAQLTPVLEAMRTQCEYAAACGGVVLKPYPDGGRISVDFVPPGAFLPTAWDARGRMTGAVFVERLRRGAAWYTRLERHALEPEGYVIQNRAFVSASEQTTGKPCALSAVPEWAELEPECRILGANGAAPDAPLFSYLKMPFANQEDPDSPLGVSVYSRAEKLIEEADRQYSRILWEYEGGELAVDASIGAVQADRDGGFAMPRHADRLFRELAVDKGDGGDLYSVFSPALRDESLFNGLNQLLKRIEFACCLSYGTLSDPQSVAKTAEEIKMSKQRSYAAVADIQCGIERALRELVAAMDRYATLYRLAPEGEYEAVFRFGDAVVTDTAAERAAMRQDCLDGAAAWWEYRARFYGEDEATARARAAEAAGGKERGTGPG